MPLEIGSELPRLAGNGIWILGGADLVEKRQGPLLVQFWARSCPACKNSLPFASKLISEFSNLRVMLLSVHMPRRETDLDISLVEQMIEDFDLPGVHVADNDHSLGAAFQVLTAWPSYLLFDENNRLRSRASGMLGIKMARNSLVRLV